MKRKNSLVVELLLPEDIILVAGGDCQCYCCSADFRGAYCPDVWQTHIGIARSLVECATVCNEEFGEALAGCYGPIKSSRG